MTKLQPSQRKKTVPQTRAAAVRAGLPKISVDFDHMSDAEASQWLHIGKGTGRKGSIAALRKPVASGELADFTKVVSPKNDTAGDRTVVAIGNGQCYVCYYNDDGSRVCHVAPANQIG